MALLPGLAFNIFIAAALALLAALLLGAGRRRSESVLLAVFLGLVAVNFLAIGLSFLPHGRTAEFTSIGFFVLAFDPVYLVAFVTLYPYRRRPPPVQALLGVLALTAALSAYLAITDPSWTPLPFSLPKVLSLGNLLIGYAAAWVLAVRSAVEAPTPLLARRAAWLVLAVGVAVLPRVWILPTELLPGDANPLRLGVAVPRLLLDYALQVPVVLAVFVAGAWPLRAARRPGELVATVKVLGAFVALLLVGLLVVDGLLGSGFRNQVPYGIRWLVFGAILVYGMLAYEVVEFSRSAERVIPLVGGLLGALAAFLGTVLYAESQGATGAIVVPLAFGVAMATSLPVAFATRATVRTIEAARGRTSGAERRLELYRAALESAWARGPPDAASRRRLEQDRRDFGVSSEEARALEHVVASSVAPKRARLAPGEEIAPGLVLAEVLGEGSQGRVFLARDAASGGTRVVKELHPDHLGGEGRQRLLREMRPLKRLAHPNLARLVEVHVVGGRYLLEMEHVPGKPLADLLRGEPWPAPRVASLGAQLLDALQAAHDAGVVHRDVKPSNILVGGDDRAWLTDFGIATIEGDEDAVRATVTGLEALGGFEGTLAYMAPEQIRGERATPATDLYAVGLVLYEALTGSRALGLERLGFFAALERVARPDIDLARVPTAWRGFLQRALQVEPAERFQAARAMRAALPRPEAPATRGRGR